MDDQNESIFRCASAKPTDTKEWGLSSCDQEKPYNWLAFKIDENHLDKLTIEFNL